MTTFDLTVLDDTVIAHKKGITLQQGRQLRDNPLAITEGASGAPKLALKSDSGAFSTANKDFVGIGAWSGVWFSVAAYNSGATDRTISIAVTDDGGTTYLAAVTLYTLPGGKSVQITGFLDFATGLVRGTYAASAAAGVISQTIAGASLSIDGVRFRGATDITAGVMIHPNGGESAT